jgi:hypothetical protein
MEPKKALGDCAMGKNLAGRFRMEETPPGIKPGLRS